MTASVPEFHEIEDTKQVLARMMELAFEAVRLTGDGTHLVEPMRLARQFYEEEMKVAGNLGRYDWAYIEEIRKSLERAEKLLEGLQERRYD